MHVGYRVWFRKLYDLDVVVENDLMRRRTGREGKRALNRKNGTE